MAFRSGPARVFVRGLSIEAEVGVHAHERGRRQPLIIDTEAVLNLPDEVRLGDTFDYERIGRAARALADGGHFDLVETFARRLAEALMTDDRLIKVTVRVEKPLALAPAAKAGGVELTLERV